MLSEVLPGRVEFNKSDIAKRSEGNCDETRANPVITPAGTLSPPEEDDYESLQRKPGVENGQESAGRCDTIDYSMTTRTNDRSPIRTNPATAGYPLGGATNLLNIGEAGGAGEKCHIIQRKVKG